MKKIIIIVFTILFLSICMCLSSFAISDEEAIQKFKDATVVSEWFGTMYGYNDIIGIGNKNNYPTANESIIVPVTLKNGDITHKIYAECCYCTRDDLSKYMHTLFSDELVEHFLNTDADDTILWKNGEYDNSEYVFGEHKMFEEIEGVLYYYGDKYQEGDIRITDISIVENSDERVTIKIKYEIWVGSSESPEGAYDQTYNLIKNNNGEWIFEEFPIPSKMWSIKAAEINNPQTSDINIVSVLVLTVSAITATVQIKRRKSIV